MTERKYLDPARMDVAIAVLIALVSPTTALAAWQTNIVGSSAAEANRQGLLDALKRPGILLPGRTLPAMIITYGITKRMRISPC